MTQEQFNQLKEAEHLYHRWVQIKEIDGSNQTNIYVNMMRDIYKDVFKADVDMHCGSCKDNMIVSLYECHYYKSYTLKLNQEKSKVKNKKK